MTGQVMALKARCSKGHDRAVSGRKGPYGPLRAVKVILWQLLYSRYLQ